MQGKQGSNALSQPLIELDRDEEQIRAILGDLLANYRQNQINVESPRIYGLSLGTPLGPAKPKAKSFACTCRTSCF